ncbi:hypothetical protein VHUM_00825 [Vanrija humicola]|uniref:Fungal pheromone STE3G-protein-coupled receptor n=1 Tax=Vanrija humicola TaxID=5417 RepID=A0A7D8V4K5_VANHU|nr:hypothetical protein VHUM_00825 [Vanrija humicola]
MHDTPHTLFSGLGVVLVLLPLTLQWRAHNTSTIFNLLWILVIDLVAFINSIMWWDNYRAYGLVWGDISAKVLTASPVCLAASSLCINRRLATIASSRSVMRHENMRMSKFLDIFIAIGIPLIVMTLSYIVQPHRFDIVEGVGVQPVIYRCLPAIFLVYIWPVILSLISATYGCIAVRFFVSRRRELRSLLLSSHSGLDVGQYLRLIGLASADLLCGFPVSVYYLFEASQNLRPWVSWNNIHAYWLRVDSYGPEHALRSASLSVYVLLPRWGPPLMCTVAFLFFAVGDDAAKKYHSWAQAAFHLISNKESETVAM